MKSFTSFTSFDDLRSGEGPTTKAFTCTKLIAAFLALRVYDESVDFPLRLRDITNEPQNAAFGVSPTLPCTLS